MPKIITNSDSFQIMSDEGKVLVWQYTDGYKEKYWYDAAGNTIGTDGTSSKYDDKDQCIRQLGGSSLMQRVFDDYGNVIAEYRDGSWGTNKTIAYKYRRRADGSVEAYGESRTNYTDYWSWYAAIKQPDIVIDEEYAAKEQARIDADLASRKKAKKFNPYGYHSGPMISSAQLDSYYRAIQQHTIDWADISPVNMPTIEPRDLEPPPRFRFRDSPPLAYHDGAPVYINENRTFDPL